MPLEIGSTLKKYRNEAQISVKQISDMLVKKGFKASEKTIYSWECGNSQPSPDALLVMCAAYGIKDVLSAFGYESAKNDNTLILNNHETELIEKYRTIATRSPEGKKNVDFMIDNEYERCRPRDIPGQTSLFDLLTPEEREQIFARSKTIASTESIASESTRSTRPIDFDEIFKMFDEMQLTFNSPEMNAAHPRTNIDIPPNIDTSENDIMDDEKF